MQFWWLEDCTEFASWEFQESERRASAARSWSSASPGRGGDETEIGHARHLETVAKDLDLRVE